MNQKEVVTANRCEQLKAKLMELIAEKETSGVRIKVVDFDNSQKINNEKNFKTMRLDYLPTVNKVIVESKGQRNEWDIPDPVDQMAFNLIKKIT